MVSEARVNGQWLETQFKVSSHIYCVTYGPMEAAYFNWSKKLLVSLINESHIKDGWQSYHNLLTLFITATVRACYAQTKERQCRKSLVGHKISNLRLLLLKDSVHDIQEVHKHYI